MKVEILKLDHYGRGITYLNDKICFVENALPGEIVKIKVVKETKKYLLGKVVDYFRLSDDRVDAACRYSDVCGGCNLEHLAIEAENSFKCLKVKEILKKFADISSDVVYETNGLNEYGYRNKVTLHGDNNILGYYEKSSNKIVAIDQCLLADETINKMINVLNEMATTDNIEEALIRINNECDEIMLSLKGKIDDYSRLSNLVDTLIVNDEVLLGEGSVISSIGEKKYYVSTNSFFQVNKELTKLLYDEVLNVVEKVKPKRVLDLYCGTGTIGIYISDLVDEVIGVDYSRSGIDDANRNKELNNCCNVKFICDKVENVISDFNNIDMVVVDPPRAGLDLKTVEHIKRIGSETLVYISCDPVTLARDLKVLSVDYNVIAVKPYNMFPRTYHVENVVLLCRKNVV